MEEYEILKKYFIDKEKENIKLKEELDMIKSKMVNNINTCGNNNTELNISHNHSEILDNSELNLTNNNALNNSNNKISHSKQGLATFRREGRESITNLINIENNPGNTSNLNITNHESSRNSPVNTVNKRSKSEISHELLQNQFQLHTSPDVYTHISYIDTPLMNNNVHTTQNNNNFGRERENNEGKLSYLDFGRLYEEKSRSSNNILKLNKGVIKNIENNITQLKKHLNTYETAYEDINNKLESTNMNNLDIANKSSLEKNENKTKHNLQNYYTDTPSMDFNPKLKFPSISDEFSSHNYEEIKKIHNFYENEFKLKNESFNQNVILIKKTNQEEIRKLRIDYETKIDEIIKKDEEEKLELKKKISQLEKELVMKNSRNEINEKNERNEVVDFQKKYLNEMKDLQKAFEDFKKKTYEEFKILKKAKEEATTRANFYKENYDSFKNKFESVKLLMNNTENMKNQLENSKTEINFLKLKILKMENFEKNVKEFLKSGNNFNHLHGNNMYNSHSNNQNMFSNNDKNIQIDMNYLTEGGESFYKNVLFSNKSSDLVNYDTKNTNQNIFSPPGTTKGPIPINKNNTNNHNDDYDNICENLYQRLNENNHYNAETLEENLYKVIDLKKAHMKIKEMEDCLKSMNDENENLKGRLGYVISNLNTPSHTNESNTSHLTRQNSKNLIKNNSNLNTIIVNTNTTNVKKKKNAKTYSAQIYEDANKPNLLEISRNNNSTTNNNSEIIYHTVTNPNVAKSTRDLTPPLQKSTVSKAKELKLHTEREYTPLVSSRSKNITNITNVQNKTGAKTHRKENSGSGSVITIQTYNRSGHNSNDEEIDVQETNEDNIFEFPLQLKIKGKIKKISTHSSKKK